jgi:2,4-dienoyl-CoA reductase-like NADH-dependent reductase (Old Yellow Enzyme family)
MRFPLEVVRRVRDVLPGSVPVLVKTNLRDGFHGGLEIDESIRVAQGLASGGADALVLSGGFVSRDAMYLFRGERPLRDMIAVEKHWPQKIALALFGPSVVKAYPFEPLFFLPLARQVRAAVKMPLVLLGGITSRADLEVAMSERFELAAMARALVHDPGLVGRLARGEVSKSGCRPCNRCVAEMDRRGGVVCALRDDQVARRRDRTDGEVPL